MQPKPHSQLHIQRCRLHQSSPPMALNLSNEPPPRDMRHTRELLKPRGLMRAGKRDALVCCAPLPICNRLCSIAYIRSYGTSVPAGICVDRMKSSIMACPRPRLAALARLFPLLPAAGVGTLLTSRSARSAPPPSLRLTTKQSTRP